MGNELNILEMFEALNHLNDQFTYEKICCLSEEQKKCYHLKLENFIKYNEMSEYTQDAPANLRQLKGQVLEDLVSYLLRISGNLFEVKQNLHTSTNEIDQIFQPTPKGKLLISHGLINERYNLFLGECKNYQKSIDVTYIGKFCSLLITNQVKMGIMFSYHGVSGSGWNYGAGLIKKFYLHKEREKERFCIIDFSKIDFEAIDAGYNFLSIVEKKLLALQFDTDFKRFLAPHPAEE